MSDELMVCGFCGGAVVRGGIYWEHESGGARVDAAGPGDFVSARHNRAGTRVLVEDLMTVAEYEAE